MSAETFDAGRAWLRGPDFFLRYAADGGDVALSEVSLPDDAELIVASRGGESHAFLMRELTHPHMAQGKLAGEPYLVSF